MTHHRDRHINAGIAQTHKGHHPAAFIEFADLALDPYGAKAFDVILDRLRDAPHRGRGIT